MGRQVPRPGLLHGAAKVFGFEIISFKHDPWTSREAEDDAAGGVGP